MSSDPDPEPDTTSLVSELISSLQLIVSREENLRRVLKEKEKRIEWLETERLERIQEVGDLRAKVEGYAKRIEELLRNEVEVKARNRELEVEKLKAEKEVEVYGSKFSVLEIKLENLERGYDSLCSFVDVEGGRRRDVNVRNGGEMRMDGEGKIGSRTNSSTASEKIVKAAVDSVNAYENNHLKANGVGCFMGNGVINGIQALNRKTERKIYPRETEPRRKEK